MTFFMTSVNISLCYQWACNRIQPRLLCRLGWKGMLETPVARQTGEKGLSLFKFFMYLSSISAVETSLSRKPVYETKVPFTPIKQESPELLGSSLSDHTDWLCFPPTKGITLTRLPCEVFISDRTVKGHITAPSGTKRTISATEWTEALHPLRQLDQLWSIWLAVKETQWC